MIRPIHLKSFITSNLPRLHLRGLFGEVKRRFVQGYTVLLAAIFFAIVIWVSGYAFPDQHYRKLMMACAFGAALLFHFASPQTITSYFILPDLSNRRFSNHWLTELSFWFGVVVIVNTLAYLEFRQPYYFTQDDNHSQFMPIIIDGCRGFFRYGILPTWNGFQHLGMETFVFGYFGFAYPLLYLSYAIATFVFGQEVLTIEVYGWLHFLIGYTIFYCLLRLLNVRGIVATTAGVCFILLGFNLIAGRSWYTNMAMLIWLPALIISVFYYMRGDAGFKWWVLTALVIAMFYCAGHPQFWLFSMLFWALHMAVVWLCRPSKIRNGLIAVSSSVAGMALLWPLYRLQDVAVQSSPRPDFGSSNLHGIDSLLLPFPWAFSKDFFGYGVGSFYYFGTLFLVAAIIKIWFEICVFFKGKISGQLLIGLTFSLAALFSFFMFLGYDSTIWGWLHRYYPFNKCRVSARMLPFLAFYCCLIGALILQQIVTHHRLVWRWVVYSACFASMGAMVYNARMCNTALYYYNDQPYPTLPEGLTFLQQDQDGPTMAARVTPFTYWRSRAKGYVQTQSHYYPSYYRILVNSGYTPSVEVDNPYNQYAAWLSGDRWKFYQEYGIRWVLFGNSLSNIEKVPDDFKRASDAIQPIDNMVLMRLENKNTKPIVFNTANPQVPYLYQIMANGVRVYFEGQEENTTGFPKTLELCFLWREGFTARTKEGKFLTVEKGEFGRIRVKDIPKTSMIKIEFMPPLMPKVLAQAGLISLASLLLLGLWLCRLQCAVFCAAAYGKLRTRVSSLKRLRRH